MPDGLKTGPGDDPFDDDDEEDSTDDEPVDVGEGIKPGAAEMEFDADQDDAADSATDDEDADIPYLLRRSNVKDDRTDVAFALRDDTRTEAEATLANIKRELDTKVYSSDFREAAFLVGLQHTDEVVELLRDWGYEYR
jgi:hypothetical protein